MPRKSLPRIEAVEATDRAFTLLVRWRLGGESRVDLSGPIQTFRVFSPLRNDARLFGEVRVGEHGTDIVWTDEIDMAAETLWRLAQEQAGHTLTSGALREWRERHAFTQETAARALGLSRRTLAYYEQGDKPIPRTVALATRGLDAELSPSDGAPPGGAASSGRPEIDAPATARFPSAGAGIRQDA